MIYVNRANVPVPKILISGEYSFDEDILSRLENKSKFSQSRFYLNQELLLEVKEDLIQLFNNKCAYCDSYSEDLQIDHFRPSDNVSDQKGFADEGYFWLSYSWFNLYLACGECIRYKSNYFPVVANRLSPPLIHVYKSYESLKAYVDREEALLVDPCKRRMHEHPQFSYSIDGQIFGKSDNADYTIELLQLNRSNLVERRKTVLDDISDLIERINLSKTQTDLVDKLINHLQVNNEFLGLQHQIIAGWFYANEKLLVSIYPSYFQKLSEILNHMVPDWSSNLSINYEDYSVAQTSKTVGSGIMNAMDNAFQKKINIIDDPFISERFSKFIESVEIINYKCIKHVKLIVPQNTEGEGEQSMLLIGENGVGKSSILQAISLAMLGHEKLQDLNLGSYNDLIRHKAKNRLAKIKVKFLNEKEPVEVVITPKSISCNRQQLVKPIVAIGSIRRLPEIGEKVDFNDDLSRILSLFRHDVVFPHVEPWLGNTSTVNSHHFNEAAKSIKDMLMISEATVGTGRIVNRKNGNVTVNVGNGPESIKSMCDGYRSVIGYALYIMRVLNLYWESAYSAEGIIIIDEIGNHLHPTWKIKVVDLLRQVFPKCTLIVSTHDPLCLRAAREGEVWVMHHDQNGKNLIIEQKDIPLGMSLENLLIGDWFYMEHTTDAKTSKLVEEHSKELFKQNPDVAKIKILEAQLEQTVLKNSTGISKLDTLLEIVNEEQKKNTVDLSDKEALRNTLAQQLRNQIKS